MTIDLHAHTTASDGTAAPEDVVRDALAAGVDVLAITDHDSVDGIDPAVAAASGTALVVVPGVELSAEVGTATDVHILGYFIDHRSPALLAELERLRLARLDRARLMVAALAEAGYDLTLDDVLVHARAGAVGRSHVARALTDAGCVESVEHAFRDLIGRDGPFFVRKRLLSGERAVAVIREAGGVAVIAHPGVTRADQVIPSLIAAGMGGIEAYHAEHTRSDRDRYAAMARRLGLVATGGSDHHGPGTRSAALGSGGTPDAAVDSLRTRATIAGP